MKKILVGTVVIIALLFFVQRHVVIVEGDSMSPSLTDGEIHFTRKQSGLKHGDIVLIKLDDRIIIKRVIGMTNDVVEFRHSHLYLNGKCATEDYVNGKTSDLYCEVPENKVFVLGDNRSASLDSRSFGCISVNKIIGVVW